MHNFHRTEKHFQTWFISFCSSFFFFRPLPIYFIFYLLLSEFPISKLLVNHYHEIPKFPKTKAPIFPHLERCFSFPLLFFFKTVPLKEPWPSCANQAYHVWQSRQPRERRGGGGTVYLCTYAGKCIQRIALI